MRNLITACVFVILAVPARANDDELNEFRKKEEPAYFKLAQEKSWIQMLERASDLLIKLPGDPFALGWAGVALTRLGYFESGAALMRVDPSSIQNPDFHRTRTSASTEINIVVRANGTPLTELEAAKVRPILEAWASELLRAPEPLPKNISSATLRAVSTFLSDVRNEGISLAPSKNVKFEDAALSMTIMGLSRERPFPELTIQPAGAGFAGFSSQPEWVQAGPLTMEVRLERIIRVPVVATEDNESLKIDGMPVSLRAGRSDPLVIRIGPRVIERRTGTQVWQTTIDVPADAVSVQLPRWPRVEAQALLPAERVKLTIKGSVAPPAVTSAVSLAASTGPIVMAPGSYAVLFERPGAVLEGAVDILPIEATQVVSVAQNANRGTLDVSVPRVVADDCSRSPKTVIDALTRVPDEKVLIVTLPDWLKEVSADYFGCSFQGNAGTIRLPYQDWPGATVVLRFGEHQVSVASPAKPGTIRLKPTDYEWMRGTLVLTHVPPDFTGHIDGAVLPCRWDANVGRCTVPTGPFSVDVKAEGRVATRVSGTVAANEESPHELKLLKADLLHFDWLDSVAVGFVGVGGLAIGTGFGLVALTQQDLKNIDGVIPVGKAEEARNVEIGSTIAVVAGAAVSVAALGVEAWLLGSDVVESGRLPEWE